MVEVGNDTNTLTTCYRHGESSDGQSIMDINCEQPVVGKVVRISLTGTETADLVICEVEIYGGKKYYIIHPGMLNLLGRTINSIPLISTKNIFQT